MEMTRSKNVKEFRRVLYCFGWYSRFLENKAEIKVPLVKHLRKKPEWNWGNEEEQVFQKLKRALYEAPILARPGFTVF